MFKKGDMLKCYLTGNDAAVVGVYAPTCTMSGEIVGQRIKMECSERKNAEKCEFYQRCMGRLKYIESKF